MIPSVAPTLRFALGTALLLAAGPRRGARAPSFQATAILERRPAGDPPRVRFEWTPRATAVEYLLTGSWTRTARWTVERGEFRVTARTATSWTGDRITFEVSLPSGDHSWRLAPVHQPSGPGQAEGGDHLRFDLR